MKRRKFFTKMMGVIYGLIGFITTLGLVKFVSHSRASGKRAPIKLEDLEAIRSGSLEHFPDSGAWVIKGDKQEDTKVFDDKCVHLGCKYKWDSARDRFHCPCHGSEFSKDGERLKGPAKGPLNRLYLKNSGGDQAILTGKP